MLSFTFLCILLWAINLLKTTFDNSLTLKNKTVSTPSMQLVLVLKSSRRISGGPYEQYYHKQTLHIFRALQKTRFL